MNEVIEHLKVRMEKADPQHRQAIEDRILQFQMWLSRGLTEEDERVQEAIEEARTHF